MSKYTPGPWFARQRAGKPFVTHGNATNSESIALIQSRKIEDANLIAAAPEMLRALKAMMPWFCPDEKAKDCNITALEILDIISKAEGK